MLKLDDVKCFAWGTAALLLLSAVAAAILPFAFSVAIVFLFAGPHIWVELRYFLSRLPSRFGPWRRFFFGSFAGIIALCGSYILLLFLMNEQILESASALLLFRLWLLLLHVWLAFLLLSRARQISILSRNSALFGLCLSAFLAILAPEKFSLFLAYLHPLIGLIILDRELKRSRPTWLISYRRICLILLPLTLFAMGSFLWSAANIEHKGIDIERQIVQESGAYIFQSASPHMLVSVHAFLEMLHYGVWVIAIPLATRALSRRRWRPEFMPITRSRPELAAAVKALLLFSSFAVLALWLSFCQNYVVTRELYFTFAIFHIIAELPFLLWML
ncbi:MAG: hypothetical protein K2X27_11430 [Candidatus Obscuribacterales bacterium]|nr:hypothetical protein [Candidatus Obscuribacterales bacterium]